MTVLVTISCDSTFCLLDHSFSHLDQFELAMHSLWMEYCLVTTWLVVHTRDAFLPSVMFHLGLMVCLCSLFPGLLLISLRCLQPE